ncbi:MAG: HelD family protein [Acidimicrobiales bacterium]
MTHPEIASEQAYLDRAHDRLEAMREAARAVGSEVLALGVGGTFANRLERDVRVELAERRLAQLRISPGALCFGRLDMAGGERLYIGRTGIFDENGDPLVIDWRAPVAEAFYRATQAETCGVVRRRHFLFRARRLTAIEDELLDPSAPGSDDLVLMGEAALLNDLERGRTGRMRDIVATIQAEQDAVVRADLAGALVVQGGAGTGKTAVALHRAAYLLYTHRLRLEREGVLLLGPSALFLRYIDQVLPSLGEHTVTLCTPPELYGGHTRPRGSETTRAAALKGDRRMAQVLERAVATRQRPLREPLVTEVGGLRIEIGIGETSQLVRDLSHRRGAHNGRRAVLERALSRALLRAWRVRRIELAERKARAALSSQEASEMAGELSGNLRRLPGVREALERMWPVLAPEELLNDLFGTAALLRRACAGILESHEMELLDRPRSNDVAEVAWTPADMALLDEAAMLLGGKRQGRPAAGRHRSDTGEADAAEWLLDRALDDRLPDCPACGAQLTARLGADSWNCERCGRSWRHEQVLSPGEEQLLSGLRAHLSDASASLSGVPAGRGARYYGHGIVDEAQAMSAMGWGALVRRVPSGSLTILGDLAQASGAGSPGSWDEVLELLPSRSRARVVELTVNYRTPEEVMRLALPLLEAASPGVTPPRSARASGAVPVISAARPTAGRARGGEALSGAGFDQDELDTVVARAVDSERRAIGEGRVAVIAPEEMLGRLGALLEVPSSLAEATELAGADRLLSAPVAAFSVDAARGLEFDSVVLVEPRAIVGETLHGLRALYVAMTRTTRRLHIVHASGLPRPLAEAVANHTALRASGSRPTKDAASTGGGTGA